MKSCASGLALAEGRSSVPLRKFDRSVHSIDKRGSLQFSRRGIATQAATTESPPSVPSPSFPTPSLDNDQLSREGSYEAPLVQLQASKKDAEQPTIASILPAADLSTTADVGIVGCGPAGLALASELAKTGIKVVLVGHDAPFVNNYGVWVDEFSELGLEHVLDYTWKDAICYFREGKEVRVGRAYGRVCRRRLRDELLKRCAAGGVTFFPGEVESVDAPSASASTADPWSPTVLKIKGQDAQVKCKLATLASGAAAGRLLKYEKDAPTVAAQTAYGIEAEVEGYGDSYDLNAMLFMDYRRHHSGLYPNTAGRQIFGKHPNGAQGLWGTEKETPSFLYAMPLDGNRVF